MKSTRLLPLLAAAMLLCACGSGGGPGQPTQTVASAAPAPSPSPVPPPPPAEARPVVFMGDSITALWSDLPGLNAGISGQTTDQMLDRFQRDVLDRKPSTVVILGGTNDVYRQDMPSTRHIDQMADMAAASGACVILGTLPPVFVSSDLERTIKLQEAWNADVIGIAHAHAYIVADYRPGLEQRPEAFGDGVHPNAAGYALMRPVLDAALAECGRR